MEMSGEQHIPLPQQRVWEALNDPEILKACIPGCESIERVSENEYKVAMTAAVGPVKAKFAGKLLLSDINPPNSYSLAFEGSGGAAGFGKGSAQVNLAPESGGTLLTYRATASVGGRLAQIGSRLIDGVAKKMSDDFFVRFNKTVTPAAEPAVPAGAGQTDAPASRAPAKSPLPIWVWVVGGIVLLLIVLSFA
ncbi:MAG TPA: carbon monoxide dehydrogenase subunit G [Burkholderiales bacterium]